MRERHGFIADNMKNIWLSLTALWLGNQNKKARPREQLKLKAQLEPKI